MNNQHQIRRITVYCKCTGRMDSPDTAIPLAHKTAEALNAFCWKRLPDLLDTAFRKANISLQEGIVNIDTLDIDLGQLRLSQLEGVLAQKLEDSLRHTHKITEATCFQKWFFSILSSYLTTGVSPWNSSRLSHAEWIDGLSSHCADVDFRYFLHELAAQQGDIVMQRMASLLDGLGMETTGNGCCLALSDKPITAAYPHGSQMPLSNDAIIVNNAGLVLLAPFLPFFFKRLSLVDEEYRFLSSKHCIQGIKILQRLTAPEAKVFIEGDLSLNKLLCGWPLYEPLPLIKKEVSSDEHTNEECAKLLNAVTEQWDAIKDYSHKKVAKSFFKRSGMLQIHGAQSLHVEWYPQDVLLNKLPWALSIIQTPWMEAALKVAWNR